MKKKFDLKLKLNTGAIEKLSDKMSQKVVGGVDSGLTTSQITSKCDNVSATSTTAWSKFQC